MAIYNSDVQEFSSGFDKEIDESARDLIRDMVQVNQYQYPIKSAIREIVSNSVDAIKERDVARLIITGKAKEEEYFIRRDDPRYKDSNFDSSYYNLNWLSGDKTVTIIYEESGLERDRIRILDNGTGLGGKRLEGYFRLGYSTKRNSKLPLGKFGIGAKAGLSTGVDYYTVVTRYNGMEFHFNVYAHKIDSTTPTLDINTGHDNPYVTFKPGTPNEYRAYWIPTKKLNGTEIILEVKKHRKQEYIDAVKSQLLYFDGIKFIVRKPTGYGEEINVNAKILYENDSIIISNNTQYSKPHLIINRVNYGYIDWDELGLEDHLGSVGIKVAAEDVSINPSRESVIWNDRTKETIIAKFKEASQTATNLVQERLKDTDIFVWLKSYLSLHRTYMNNSSEDLVAKLAGIVDLRNLNPGFSLDRSIRPGSLATMFPGMKLESINLERKVKGGIAQNKTSREPVKYISEMDPSKPIYMTTGKVPPRKLQYLLSQNVSGYYFLRYPADPSAMTGSDIGTDDDESSWILAFDLHLLATNLKEKDPEYYNGTGWQEIADELRMKRIKVTSFIEKSTVPIKLETVVVPNDFVWNESWTETADDKDVVGYRASSAEDRRKLEERVILHTPRYEPHSGDNPKLYTWQKVEPKLKEVLSFEGDDVYYSTEEDSPMLYLVAGITRPKNEWTSERWQPKLNYTQACQGCGPQKDDYERVGILQHVWQSKFTNHWWDSPVILMKMAKDEVKRYKNYRHISEFFIRVEAGTLTMSKKLIEWYTGLLIANQIKQLDFLENFKRFDADKYTKHKELVQYQKDHYRDLQTNSVKKGVYYSGYEPETIEELLVQLHKVFQLQLFVHKNPTDHEAIKDLSLELFEKEYANGIAVDMAVWEKLEELIDYAQPIKTMFNNLNSLVFDEESDGGSQKPITTELEQEIRSYLEFKGL